MRKLRAMSRRKRKSWREAWFFRRNVDDYLTFHCGSFFMNEGRIKRTTEHKIANEKWHKYINCKIYIKEIHWKKWQIIMKKDTICLCFILILQHQFRIWYFNTSNTYAMKYCLLFFCFCLVFFFTFYSLLERFYNTTPIVLSSFI